MKLGVAADGHRARALPPILDFDLAPEIGEHALGMISRRQRFDDCGAARRMHAGKQDGRLHLRRGHRKVVDDGKEVLRAAHHERQGRALRLTVGLQAHGGQRRKHPPHGPAPQGRIAGEFDLHVVARDHAEHEPAPGAGIAEVERRGRRAQAAHPLTPHLEGPVRPGNLGAERGHGLRRGHHVLGLKQPGDAGVAGGQGPQDQRAMGNRLVARHARAAGKARGRTGGQGLRHGLSISRFRGGR